MRKLPVLVLVFVVGLLAAAVPSVSALAASKPEPLKVTVDDDFFKPSKKTVPPGTKVTWTWKGSDEHNVTLAEAPKGIKLEKYTSEDQDRDGDPFTRTLKARGKWLFVCTLHPEMEQTITVK